MKLEKLFVPSGIALMAKEKGFDEECISFYSNGVLNMSRIESFDWCIVNSEMEKQGLNYVSAPLYQQLIDWFEEKHKIFIEVRKLNDNKWCYQVHGPLNGDMIHVPGIEIKYEAYNEVFKEAFKLIKK